MKSYMRKEFIFGTLGILVLISLTFDEIKRQKAVFKTELILQDKESYNNLIDPWGTEFQVENVNDGIRVISAGPDKKLNTRDDILLLKRKKSRKIGIDFFLENEKIGHLCWQFQGKESSA